MDIRPSTSLYLNNLNEKIRKDDLKKGLYFMFSQYGQILDIVALKTIKMRGQAFIIFKDLASSSTALRALQGFPFYSRPMKISYAKSESNASAKRKIKSYDEEKQASAAAAQLSKPTTSSALVKRKSQPAEATTSSTSTNSNVEDDESEVGAHNVLFLSSLPPESNEMMLAMLFKQFAGYKESRLVSGRNGIAFVEFEGVSQATTAKKALQGFKLSPTNSLSITYAKK